LKRSGQHPYGQAGRRLHHDPSDFADAIEHEDRRRLR